MSHMWAQPADNTSDCVYAEICIPDYDDYDISSCVNQSTVRIMLHGFDCGIEIVTNVIDTKTNNVILETFKKAAPFKNDIYTCDRKVIISRDLNMYNVSGLHDITDSQLQYMGYWIVYGVKAMNEILKPDGLSIDILQKIKDDHICQIPDKMYDLCTYIMSIIGKDLVNTYKGLFGHRNHTSSVCNNNKCKLYVSRTHGIYNAEPYEPEHKIRDVILNFFNLDDDIIQKKLASMS